MTQNKSPAVMQQRHEPHDSLDYFPTPPWATRALCERLMQIGMPLTAQSVWEPACGEGHMARPLGEYFATVFATDVHYYGDTYADQYHQCDFLNPYEADQLIDADWIITNPPFKLASQFVHTGLRYARYGVAMFVRTSFLEGIARYNELFSKHRPAMILQFSERVPLIKGRLDKNAKSATSYCWLVWDVHPCKKVRRFEWIAPCRARLEHASDYPVDQVDLPPAPLFDATQGE